MSSLFNHSENDLPLRPRGAGELRGTDDLNTSKRPGPEREVTLSTGTVLLLFFALALLCVGFFAFGYSTGRKSVTTAAAATGASDAETVSTDGAKAAPGLQPATPVPGYVGPVAAERSKAAVEKPSAAAGDVIKPAPVRTEPAPAATEKSPPAEEETPSRAAAPKPVTAAPVVRLAPPAAAPNGPAAGVAAGPANVPTSATGTIYVQIVAVSHQEDANVVMAALRRRGYSVTQRSTNTDPLIHVQIGPFATRRDAEAMRARLSGDGYNAILK